MNEAYSSFSTDRRRFGVMLLLTVDRRAGPPAVDGWTLASWCCRTCVGLFMLIRPAPSPWPVEGVTAWGLHPIGAEVVEPGVEVKLRLLDALDW